MAAERRSAFGPRDAVLLGLLALLWGHSFLFIKIAVAAVPPPWIVMARMSIGGALLLALSAWFRQRLPRDRKVLLMLAVIGFAGGALPWCGQAWAQHQLDSGLVAVLNACTPLATLVMAVLAKQEFLNRNRIVGIGIAISGTVIVVGGELGSGRSLPALVMAVLATIGYALGAVLTRARISGRVAPLPAAATQLVLGALLLSPIALTVSPLPAFPPAPAVAGALLALGLFGTGAAFHIYFTLIERVGATNTSMVTYLIPVVGLTSGAIFRGERFGPNVLVGALALVFGVWLTQREPSQLRAS